MVGILVLTCNKYLGWTWGIMGIFAKMRVGVRVLLSVILDWIHKEGFLFNDFFWRLVLFRLIHHLNEFFRKNIFMVNHKWSDDKYNQIYIIVFDNN